jgi:hypothetical protein
MFPGSFPLTAGALVGILLSGGFVYWEVGRYATPQVPESRFDERREMFAYTAGLFVGVPLAVTYAVYRTEFAAANLILALPFLAALVLGTEAAQYLLLRSHFWSGPAGPFYALGFRSSIGGILAIAIVAQFAGDPTGGALRLATIGASAVAVVALEVAGALMSLKPEPTFEARRGGAGSGAAIGAVGFLLLGFGALGGAVAGLAGALLLLGGAAFLYVRLRPRLDRVPPLGGAPAPPLPSTPPTYGRTERPPPDRAGPGPRS